MVLAMLIGYETLFVGEPYTLYYTLDWLVFTVTIIWGIWHCFKQNKKGDGRSFINRYISLTLPTTIRLGVFAFGALLLLGVGFFLATGAENFPDEKQPMVALTIIGISALINIVYYLWLGVWIARVSGAKPMPASKSITKSE